MKALVTGAAGFLGSHVARHLLALGMDVVAVDDLSGGYLDNVPKGAQWVHASVTDLPAMERVFGDGAFEFVFHLAAYAAEGLSPFVRRFNYQNNLQGSVNLINLSLLAQIKCFVFTSSIAVYGSAPAPMTETMTPSPEDPYGIAKYAVELDLHAARRQFGLDYIIFRPHNIYGENQNLWDPYRNVIGIFMRQALRGEPLTIFGDGQQTRAFSYVEDVAPVIARAVLEPAARGEVFNIGGDQPYTINQLTSMVGQVMGTTPEVVHLRPRAEVLHAFASHDKVRRVFHVGPSTPLREGLERMARWARAIGARDALAPPQIEVGRGLPEGW